MSHHLQKHGALVAVVQVLREIFRAHHHRQRVRPRLEQVLRVCVGEGGGGGRFSRRRIHEMLLTHAFSQLSHVEQA